VALVGRIVADVHRGQRERGDGRQRGKRHEDTRRGAGLEVTDAGEVAGDLDDVAGPGADRDGAVRGEVDVHRVAEPGAAAGAGPGQAGQQGAGGVEVGDGVAPVGGEDVAGRVDRDAPVVVAGRQRDGPQQGHRVRVEDRDGPAGDAAQGIELAVEADVDVDV